MPDPIKLSLKIPFPVVLPGDRIATIRRAQDEPDAAKRVAGVGLGPLAKALQAFDAPVAVSYYSTATPGYVAGRTTLLGLLTAEMLLHTVVVVEFGLAGEYGQAWELVYDGAGTINALREYGGPLLPVRWARTSSSAAGVPAYPERGPAYVWKVGELTRAYVTGTATELFFKAKAATVLPAPSSAVSDVNWERVAEQSGSGDLFRSVTLAEAVALLDLGTLVPGLLYAIAFPALAAQPAQTVWLQALDVYTFQGVGHVYAAGTLERTKLVTADVRTGVVTAFSAGTMTLEFVYENGFTNTVTHTIGANQAGTYTAIALSNVSSIEHKINGTVVAVSFTPGNVVPLILAIADSYTQTITRTNAATGAVVTLTN